jgi:NitT/TauT family transport system permease protein
MNRITTTLAGTLAALAAWEIVGRSHLAGGSFPPFSSVLVYLLDPSHRGLLLEAISRTAEEAAIALVAGSIAGIGLAALAALVPALSDGLAILASLVNGIPIVAVASVCVLTLPRVATPPVVASLAVGFIVFVGAAAGFASASRAHRDLFTVYGATRSITFARLLVPSALVAIVDAMRSATPLAVIGAIIGEWFSSEHGLGPLLVAAMQNYAINELWATALLCALLSIAAYGALGTVRAAVAAGFTS